MWRPGYESPQPLVDLGDVTVVELENTVEPPPTAGADDARSRWWLPVVLAVVGAVLAAAVWFVVADGDAGEDGVVVPRAVASTPTWTTEFDGRVDAVRIVDDGVVVVSALDGLVARYDLESGTAEWQVSIGPARSAGVVVTVGDVLVVGSQLRARPRQGQAEIGRVHVLDLADGSQRWTEASTAGRYHVLDGVVVRFVSSPSGPVQQLLDLGTGLPLGPVLASDGRTEIRGPAVGSIVDGGLSIHSTVDGAQLRPTIELGDLTDVAVLDGGDVVGLESSGLLVRIEPTGAVTSLAPARVDRTGGDVDLVPIGPDSFLAVGDRTERLDLVDGGVEQAWSLAGPVGRPAETALGDAAIVRLTDDTGTTSYAVVDLADGSPGWRTEPGVVRVDAPELLADGVLLPPEIGAASSLSAVDLDGRDLWSIDLPGGLTVTDVGAGAVAFASRDERSSTVGVFA